MAHINGAPSSFDATSEIRRHGLASLKKATEKLASRSAPGALGSAAEVAVSQRALRSEGGQSVESDALKANAKQIDSENIALMKANDLLARMRALALAQADPALDSKSKVQLQREFVQLKQQLSRILGDADSNGLSQAANAPSGLTATTNDAVQWMDAFKATTLNNIASADISINALSSLDDVIDAIGGERLKVSVAQSRLEYARTAQEGAGRAGSRVRDQGDAESLIKSTREIIRENPNSVLRSMEGAGPNAALELLS